MKKTLIRAFSLVLILALMLMSVGCSSAPAQELVIFSWADYIDPELLAQFTEETGIALPPSARQGVVGKMAVVQAGVEYVLVVRVRGSPVIAYLLADRTAVHSVGKRHGGQHAHGTVCGTLEEHACKEAFPLGIQTESIHDFR